MTNASVTYRRELIVPSETVNLYFRVAKEVAIKDLVAVVRCFDDEGIEVHDLKPLSYSKKFLGHFVYLRSPRVTVGDWVTTTIRAEDPIKRIEIDIARWSKDFKGQIQNVVEGVWVGATLESETTEAPVNFVAIQGSNR